MLLTLLGLMLAAVAGAQPSASPEPSPQPARGADPTLQDLYRSILPGPIDADPRTDPVESEGARAPSDAARDGLYLGRIKFSPALNTVYVRAEGALLSTAEPVKDSYYEVRPQIAAEAPISTGFVRGRYEAGIRRSSSFDVVESATTHIGDLSLQVPLGTIAELGATEHFARGVLETVEVDPGREYFFKLGRFTRQRHALGLRALPGGRADVSVAGSIDVVRVDDQAAFFDHEQQAVSAQIGYEIRPALRAYVGYGHTRVPFTLARPQAESRAHSVFGALRGEMLPLTNGVVSVGYTSLTSPNAAPGGRRFTGLTAAASLEKSFTPSSNLTLGITRATHASNFEENAFYVTTSVDLLLRAALPASLALQAGAGYHRNAYRTVASAIGAPRADAIRGWVLGLGRPVTRHAFIRADYRRERRDSNIDAFDSRTNVLTVQLGLGLFAAPR